jgi:hypothetical protein
MTDDPDVNLAWPDVSEHFIVWTARIAFFERQAFAMRFVDGRPSGEPFSIGPGGSWIELDRNIVVFNGFVPDESGQAVSAIVARELDLPGADDVGDADASGRIDVTDAVTVLRHLFAQGPRPRLRLADADHDGEISVSDALTVLRFLFLHGPRP